MTARAWASWATVVALAAFVAGDLVAGGLGAPTPDSKSVLDSRYVNVAGDWMTGRLGVDGGLVVPGTATVGDLDVTRTADVSGRLFADGGFVSPKQNVLGPTTVTTLGASALVFADGGFTSPQQNALGPTVVTGTARVSAALSTDGGFNSPYQNMLGHTEIRTDPAAATCAGASLVVAPFGDGGTDVGLCVDGDVDVLFTRAGNLTAGGTLTVTGTSTLNGATVIGDAVGDTVTHNAGAVTYPNDTTVTLTNDMDYVCNGGTDGFTVDGTTMVVDCTGNYVVFGGGTGTAPVTINTSSTTYDIKFMEMVDPTAAGSSIRFTEDGSGAAAFAPAITMSSVAKNGTGGVLKGEIPAGNDTYTVGAAAFQMKGQRVGGGALTSSDIWNLSNATTVVLRAAYNTAAFLFPTVQAAVAGSVLTATTAGVTSWTAPTYCGVYRDADQLQENVGNYSGDTGALVDFETAGLTSNAAADIATVEGCTLTTAATGVYRVEASMSFSGTANSVANMAIHVDDAIQANCKSLRKISAGGDVGSFSLACLLSLAAATTDVVTLRIWGDADTDDFTVQHANMNLVRINK